MKYIPALDGVRAVAIIVVLMFHSLHPHFRWGNIGVDIFFVLSGFLITRILIEENEREGNIKWRPFIRRRIYRLVPAILVMLVVYAGVAPLIWPGEPHLTDSLWAAIYMSDYAQALIGRPEYLGHTWSLSVEEHFYLIWPVILGWLLLLSKKRTNPKACLTIFLLVGWLLATSWRATSTLLYPFEFEFNYFRFDTRTSGLWLGAAVAALSRTHWMEKETNPNLIAVLTMVFAIAAMTSRFGEIGTLLYGISFAEISTSLVLIGILKKQEWICAPLSLPVFLWLGKISYAIYLWHYPIQYYLRAEIGKEVALVLGSALSILIAWLSWKYVEQPMLQRRDQNSTHN